MNWFSKEQVHATVLQN